MADLAGVNGLRETFKVVGKRNLPGKLSYAMATGIAKYGVDYVLPGMLFAKFLRSPYAHARILSIDCTKARAIDGVVDIITYEDEDIKKLHMTDLDGSVPMLDSIADREGVEVGAIVVAESEDICDEALQALDIEWEVLPHVVDLLDGRREDAPVIRPGETDPPKMMGRPLPLDDDTPPKRGNVNYAFITDGDPDAGYAEADHVIEYKVYTPGVAAHLPNPPGSVAWWAKDPYFGEGENLHIEGIVRERGRVSELYGIPMERIIQEGLFMGGRYCDWGVRRSQIITPFLAKRVGRPVRCVNTRENVFDYLRNERYIYMKVGFKNDGTITVVDDYSVAEGGSRGNAAFGNVGDFRQGPYNAIRTKNIRQRMEIVDSNKGIMYCSGQFCPFNWDTITVAIHLIAEKLNMDPIDVALRNVHGPDSKDDPRIVPSLAMCVEKGRELMNWNWHKAGTKKLPDGRMHGMSFRYQMCPRHSGAVYECKLEYRSGKVYMPTQGPAFGAFVVECVAMVAAEELGISYDEINIDFDYRARFRAYGGGSDATAATTWVMKECANKLKRQILEAAISFSEEPKPHEWHFGEKWLTPPENNLFKGLKPEDLDIADSRIFVKADPSKSIPFSQATSETLTASHVGRPPLSVWTVAEGGKVLDVMNTTYCEVAVDTDTGEVEILRFGAVVDPGLVFRPISFESQIDQVMYMSQGCQLTEDYIFDKRSGVLLNNNMIEYKKPGMLDVARVDKDYVESRGSDGAYGSSGISHTMANSHQVILAIYNAIGVLVDPPATPDRVLKALGKI